jgi:hypothetical protein
MVISKGRVAVLIAIVLALLAVGRFFHQINREFDRDNYGLKVKIEDDKNAPLFVLLTAYNIEPPTKAAVGGTCSKAYALGRADESVDGYAGLPYIYCGNRPDFTKLCLVIMIWDLTTARGAGSFDNSLQRKPDFIAVAHRPDFTYSGTEAYVYTSFAKVVRKGGTTFVLAPPEKP